MRIFLIALLLVTVLPVIMYKRQFNRKMRIALITIWSLSVVTVYVNLAIIYFILID